MFLGLDIRMDTLTVNRARPCSPVTKLHGLRSHPASWRKAPEGRACRLGQRASRELEFGTLFSNSSFPSDLEATSPQTEKGFISLSIPCPLPHFPCSMPRHTTRGRQDSKMPSNDL